MFVLKTCLTYGVQNGVLKLIEYLYKAVPKEFLFVLIRVDVAIGGAFAGMVDSRPQFCY